MEEKVVDPLLHLAGLEFKHQYAIDRLASDYAITKNGMPAGVVDVERRMRLTRSRAWQSCPGAQQAREYADRLSGIPFALIDCEGICLFDSATSAPKQRFLRRRFSQSIIDDILA